MFENNENNKKEKEKRRHDYLEKNETMPQPQNYNFGNRRSQILHFFCRSATE